MISFIKAKSLGIGSRFYYERNCLHNNRCLDSRNGGEQLPKALVLCDLGLHEYVLDHIQHYIQIIRAGASLHFQSDNGDYRADQVEGQA